MENKVLIPIVIIAFGLLISLGFWNWLDTITGRAVISVYASCNPCISARNYWCSGGSSAAYANKCFSSDDAIDACESFGGAWVATAGSCPAAITRPTIPQRAEIYGDCQSIGGRVYTTDCPSGFRLSHSEEYQGQTLRCCVATGEGAFSIISKPSEASVYIDDELKGATPWSGRISAGIRKIRLSKEGYNDWTNTRELNAGQTIRLNALMVIGGATTTIPPTTTIPIAKPADLNDCNSCLNSNFYWCTKAGGGVGLENNCINGATAGSGLCEEIGGAVVSNAANCPAAKAASETVEEIYDFDYVPVLIRSERTASPKTRAKTKSCDDGRNVIYGTTNIDDISEAKYCLLPRTRENYYQVIEATHPSFNREIANINKNDISEIKLVVTGVEGIDWPLKRTYSLNEANNWEIVVEHDHANDLFHKLSELAAHNTFLRYKEEYFAKARACIEFKILSGGQGVGTRDNYFGIKINWNSDGTIASFETGICDGTESYGWAAFDVYAMKIEKKLTGYIRTTADGMRIFEYANPLDALDQRCVSCSNQGKIWCYKGTYHNTCTDNSEFNNCNSNCLAICNADNPSSDCEGDCSNECQEKDFYINCGASGGRIISDANSCPYPEREPDVWFYLCDDSYQDCSYDFDATFGAGDKINLLVKTVGLKATESGGSYSINYKVNRYVLGPDNSVVVPLREIHNGVQSVDSGGYFRVNIEDVLGISQTDALGIYKYIITVNDYNSNIEEDKMMLFEVR